MSKHKSSDKEKKKASQSVIRVDKAERDAFVKLCDKLDTSAAREIRRFMREMVASQAGKDLEPDAETTGAVATNGTGDQQDDDDEKAPADQAVLEIPAEKTGKSKRKLK